MDAIYYGACSAGLEPVLLSEIKNLKSISIKGTVDAFGGVLFSTESSPEEVCKLRSVDNVYAFLGHFKDVPSEKEVSLNYFKNLAEKMEWNPATQLFDKWQQLQRRQASSPPTFRVTCERKCLKMKKHAFTSVDAAAALGESVQNLHSWIGDMRCFNIQVFGWIIDSEILLAMGLIYSESKEGKRRPSRSDAQLFSKRPYRKALVVTSLKPSVAYALLQLGHIKPGDIILDPMCGCGTIPLEAADVFPGEVMCIGGDNSPNAVSAAGTNVNGNDAPPCCDILQWDASLMPVRTGCVDWVICDMPFGVLCGNTNVRDRSCKKILQEVARVLRPESGVAILMSQGKAMREQMENTPYLKLLQQHVVDMEGILVQIHIAQRTASPVVTEKRFTRRDCRLSNYNN